MFTPSTQSVSLRPQDVLLALKLHVVRSQPWTIAQLAASVGLSASGVHGSIQRLGAAQLFNQKRREIRPRAVLEFLRYGLKYWLPAQLGPQSEGLLTAASAPPLSTQMSGGITYVWSHIEGEEMGQSVVPFHPAIPEAARRDPKLYELLALTEVFRVGRVREQELASQAMAERLGL